jgi:prophage tail gpP-like protein
MPVRPDAEDLTVRTGGRTLGGWTSVSVTRGVELFPSHATMELTERYPGQASQVVVEPTATCEVFLGADRAITGYIDRYEVSLEKDSHHVRLVVRSKTEDIVDCAVDTTTATGINGWQIKAATIGEVARIICKPYGITVSLPDGDRPFPTNAQSQVFSAYPGVTCWNLLEEMARSCGLLLWDNERGELVLSLEGTGGRAGSPLVEGVNAERVQASLTADQRFARYYVLGMGMDQEQGHINASAIRFDPEASKLRNRLRVIPQEVPDVDSKFSAQRAQWEANRRYGRSKLARVTVTGWRCGDKLWQPNTTVSVQLPTAKINEDRVISEVTWMRGQHGTQTVITVMPKGALSVQPFAVAQIVPDDRNAPRPPT